MDSALAALRQEVANAVATWPFEDGGETTYLREHYAVELRSVATEKGLAIYERDGSLISYPSIVRILPGDHAIRIDKKKVSTLRPSYLAEVLVSEPEETASLQVRPVSGISLQGLQAVRRAQRVAQRACDAAGQNLRDIHQLAGE